LRIAMTISSSRWDHLHNRTTAVLHWRRRLRQLLVSETGTGRCSDSRYSDKVESTVGSVHDFWAGRL